MPRFVLAACARWETPYIAEWLTYHRAIGYEHVYLYCNDDDPGPFLRAILPFLHSGFVTFHHHAIQGQQFEMYAHFLEHHLAENDWVSFLDIDEFLRLPAGARIADFTARFPAADCILFNWMFFGTSGHKTPPAGPVLENFTRREVELHPLTKFVARAEMLKHLDMSDRDAAHAFWHEPVTKVSIPVTGVNVLGEALSLYPDGFSGGASRAFINEPARRDAILATAVIHHYAFRSEQAFRDRVARGLGGDFAGQSLWLAHYESPTFQNLSGNWNAVEDRSLANFWEDVIAPYRACITLDPSAPPTLNRFLRVALSSEQPGPPKRTFAEPAPWWQVDLQRFCKITAIHGAALLRDDAPASYRIAVSLDAESWVDLTTDSLSWSGPGTAFARFVRITGSPGSLALGPVDIIGTPA